MSPRLFLATANPGKAREVRALLPGLEVQTLAERPLEMPEEVGESFEVIALEKARFASEALGLAVLADDSGLEVDALDGRPGVRSARYVPGTDRDRWQRILQELDGVEERSARFVCAMALHVPGATPVVVRGTCEGRIGTAAEGEGGFGYDPIFYVEEAGEWRSMASLDPTVKNARSHRGAALAAIRPHLTRLIP